MRNIIVILALYCFRIYIKEKLTTLQSPLWFASSIKVPLGATKPIFKSDICVCVILVIYRFNLVNDTIFVATFDSESAIVHNYYY